MWRCTSTYEHLGNEPRAVLKVRLHKFAEGKEHATLPAELTLRGDGRACFAGHCAGTEQDEPPEIMSLMQEEILGRRHLVFTKAAEVKSSLCADEDWVYFLLSLG